MRWTSRSIDVLSPTAVVFTRCVLPALTLLQQYECNWLTHRIWRVSDITSNRLRYQSPKRVTPPQHVPEDRRKLEMRTHKLSMAGGSPVRYTAVTLSTVPALPLRLS